MDVTGLSCVLCGEQIHSLFDGVFCSECGGPYHHNCFGKPPLKPNDQPCKYCGGDVSNPQAAAAREDRERQSMSTTGSSGNRRAFSSLDAKRAFIGVAILITAGVCYWVLLPVIQSLIIPNSPGGKSGPWVVRPILAFHYGAVVVMSAVTLSIAMRPLQRVWKRQDAILGTRYDPLHGRSVRHVFLLVKSFLLLALYASALVFFLFSWVSIGPDGIIQRLPWTELNHSFEDIVSLETIPDGQRSESNKQNGPWYSIKFKSGHSIHLSDANEGMTRADLQAMTTYISDHTGIAWAKSDDAHPHYTTTIVTTSSIRPVISSMQRRDRRVPISRTLLPFHIHQPGKRG